MEFVEPEDEPPPPYRSPLPPDDRVWRHPSEMNARRPLPRRQLWAVGLVSVLAAGVLSVGVTVVAGTLLDQGGGPGTLRSTLLPDPGPATQDDMVAIADRIRPAVVQLKSGGGGAGRGLGIIFREDGHILTNAHVVDGGKTVTAVLSDGREMEARVVGSDPAGDVAVVKIEDGPYPVPRLGGSADLRTGQRTVAVASGPGGPEATVGVVGALHRTVKVADSSEALADLIEIDVPVGPGSSGGALLDTGGNLIGMTTTVTEQGTGYDGSGFAIPIDAVRSAAERLMAAVGGGAGGDQVRKVWMGVECSDLDGPTALALKVPGGTMVDRVRPGSPAEQAGLTAGDVIVGIDGRPVTSLAMLLATLAEHRPGDVVSLDVVREGQRRAMPVTVAERPLGS